MLKVALLIGLAVIVVLVTTTLLYGRSKVQPDGSLLLQGEAPFSAELNRSFDRIVSADGLKAWWLGTLSTVEATPGWPAPGEKLSFDMGSTRVTYTSVTVDRPRRMVARGEYPDGVSTITHELLDGGAGRATYRKTVQIQLKPETGTLKAWLLGAIVGFSVPRECAKAAAYASQL